MTLTPSPPFKTPITVSLLRGWVDLEQSDSGIVPHRLPIWARSQWADPQLTIAEGQPSGVRICFRTMATILELEALPTKRSYVGTPPRPEGAYDLVIDGVPPDQGCISSGELIRIDISRRSADGGPVMEIIHGPSGIVRFAGLPDGDKRIEIWLPHNEATRLIALHSDAPVRPLDDTKRRVWLHHGSSISQGSNAIRPTGIWPAVAASMADIELLNLGFGGSALLDPFVARTIQGHDR